MSGSVMLGNPVSIVFFPIFSHVMFVVFAALTDNRANKVQLKLSKMFFEAGKATEKNRMNFIFG